jgi:dienelactone hydrolase
MSSASTGSERLVHIQAGAVTLEGNLAIPGGARGIVLFAHGSGSSRHSPRNRFVAQALREAGLGTLLLDLLTPEEETIDLRTRRLRFDIDLLAERLVGAADWLARNRDTQSLPIGCFGASTGGGAALVAAAARPLSVRAVVSRGGRPDLAGRCLARVEAPTLLLVGENDAPVIELNKEAMAQLSCPREMVLIPRATHLFEEPGALEEVARRAGDWFLRYLGDAGEDRAR